jgi:DNA repair exonuclease SbcCD nuclease subunit
VLGVWICVSILKNTVDKYVKKKMEAYYEQQQRDKKLKAKETRESRENGGRLRSMTRQVDERTEKTEKKSRTIRSESSSEVIECRRPNLRARKQKRMNIVRS